MIAPNIGTLYDAIRDRLVAIVNPDTNAPIIEEAFPMYRKRLQQDVHRMPSIGIAHLDTSWERNKVMGGGTSKDGRMHWQLIGFWDAITDEAALISPDGAFVGLGLVIDDLQKAGEWHILPGCPVSVDRGPYPFDLASITDQEEVASVVETYAIDISHAIYFED